jgi:lactoylglutathione lyase
MTTMNLTIACIDHVGIRVADAARSEAFYAKLGFALVARHEVKPPVVILRNAAGIELNLIINGDPALDGSNVLMDVPAKHAGYTHVAFRVASLDATVEALAALGVAISDGPFRLGPGRSLFVRDPDRNVVELRESLELSKLLQ